ncbi:MAG: insulinase family protein [Bdellovibrionales bacterium]|nr:insulinase family protein [Bdellovibrionales bacterium]
MSLKKTVLYFVSALCVLSASAKTPSKWSDEIQIPFTKKVLPNGLTVIVHEDHKAPIVAINIWYHVGSKNEKPGKTGFAHLFEHLMFNGSEHFDNDYFKALDKIGATSTNGSTGFDRTNYFQVVPKHAIDTVLWLESDRMGHLLGAITQEKLDEQRGVVQNEKRQRENEPYGKAYEIIAQQSFPSDHPYSWLPIGSMEDLNAASLKDVHEWFKTYYGAANAAISIAGDIETKDILQKVEHYFGGIGSGPPLAKPGQWIAKRNQSSRFVLQDRVPHARVYKAWNIPSLKSAESNTLNIFSDILANGKNSRLFKRLVYKDQIATDVSAFLYDGEISGVFYIVATAKPGQKLDHIETIVNEELTRLIQKGPTKEELERTKVSQYSSFVRNLEKVGS